MLTQELSDEALLRLTGSIYEIPSLAVWRAAELKVLRTLQFPKPVLEIGCGNGAFSSLLLDYVDVGIDIRRKEIDLCRLNSPGVYRRLECMDARKLDFEAGSFGTVFANCVIEHIPELSTVLAECRRVLIDGGRMVATVPLAEMNNHLRFSAGSYARIRAHQLQHVNLFTQTEWIRRFEAAGFSRVETKPYLPGTLCQRWDRADGPMCLGPAPLTLANVYRYSVRLLPKRTQGAINSAWRKYFLESLGADPVIHSSAILIEAFTS
jgi:SAM-dependent methyltransferase